MASNKRVCFACGKEYDYCPRNRADEDKPKWMFAYDTEECKEVFNTILKYNSQILTKAEAKEKLNAVISGNIKFRNSIQEDIDKILKEAPKPRKKRIVTEDLT